MPDMLGHTCARAYPYRCPCLPVPLPVLTRTSAYGLGIKAFKTQKRIFGTRGNHISKKNITFAAAKCKRPMRISPAELRNRLRTCYSATEAAAMARIICCEMLGQRATDFVLNEPLETDGTQARLLEDAVGRLLRFEPMQYIQGKARFLGRDFHVEPGVLIPRPETEELVERMLREIPANARIADIGTGSGCIAVTLALEVPGSRVQAWDISETALRIARQNAEALQAEVDFVHRDALAWQPEEKGVLDVIVSNPPYVTEAERTDMEPNVLLHEPEGALFVPDEDPLRFYRRIGLLGRELLAPGGRLYFEINRAYGKETADLLRRQGYTDVRTDKDLSGNDRFATATQPG